MSEMDKSEQAIPGLKLGAFNKLPGGWQRVIIAVIFVVILVGVVLLKQMIKVEEDIRQAEDAL